MRDSVGRTSYNVDIMTRIEGSAQQYRGHLVIPCSHFGTRHDCIPGGGNDHEVSQGGIVFDTDEVALEMLQALEDYFEGEKLTLRQDVSGLVYRVFYSCRSWLRLKLGIL